MPKAKKETEVTTKGCLIIRHLPLLLVCQAIPVTVILVKPDLTSSWLQVPFVIGNGLILALIFGSTYNDFLTKREIRRFCNTHGLTLAKIKVNRNIYGVTYQKDGEQKYGRWPEEFEQYKGS